jgi:aspartate/methionine/tyrosine aminotransferase
MNSSELVTRLRKEKSVFVVAGDWFGMGRYLRVGIGGETRQLIEGLQLVGEFVDQLE